jgi:hypothetical protein
VAPLWFSPYILGLKEFVAHVSVHLVLCEKKTGFHHFCISLVEIFLSFPFLFSVASHFEDAERC